jgi:hypothetical protein
MMHRLLISAAVLAAWLSGCSSPARYVEQGRDSGVVAIPANTDGWPTYHRSEALKLIEKHVGPNYEIIEEREIATGQQTRHDQPTVPPVGPTITNTTTTTNVTEWRIAYRARPAVTEFSGPLPGTSGVVQQTQYRSGSTSGVRPAGGIVPNVGPGNQVVPAIGSVPVQQVPPPG